MRRLMTTMMLVIVAIAAFVVPAVAQQPYPPPPPEPPDVEVVGEVECHIVLPERTIVCTGSGFMPGSTVTVEIREYLLAGRAASADIPAGSPGDLIAVLTATVGDDGSFMLDLALPCDFTDPYVFVRASGTDLNGNPLSVSEVLPTGDIEPCASPASDQDNDGALAFTGRNLGILLAVALALILAGAILLRRRRSHA